MVELAFLSPFYFPPFRYRYYTGGSFCVLPASMITLRMIPRKESPLLLLLYDLVCMENRGRRKERERERGASVALLEIMMGLEGRDTTVVKEGPS